MFHAHDNVCFERTGTGERYGSVRICRLRPGEEMGPGTGETILVATPEEWASITSSMTALGENAQTYQMMLALMR